MIDYQLIGFILWLLTQEWVNLLYMMRFICNKRRSRTLATY